MKRQFRILLIMFLLSAVLLSFGHLALSGEKKDRPTIKMFLNLSSNRTKYEYYRDRTIQKPVMEYYPQNDITDGLKKAGFRILPEDSKDYDLALEVNYKERFYSISIGPGQTMERIDRTVGFVLRNKEGTVVFADDMPGEPKEEAVKRYFKEELPKLVKERPTSADMVLALSDKLKKEGFDRDVLKRLGRLNDPRAIDAIVPLLRICYASYRWDVKFALWDLGYKPTSKSEKAAFDIVDLVDPFTWYYKYGKKPPKRSPLEIIEAYGIPAVDLFLEDLKCEPKLGYYAGNATAENAKKALRSLESKARSKEYNPEWEKHAAGRLVGDLTKEDAESKFRSGYIIDVIGLLAIVGDEHAIAPLKNYLDKPNYSEYAAKAIENIEKRKALPEKKSEILPTKKNGISEQQEKGEVLKKPEELTKIGQGETEWKEAKSYFNRGLAYGKKAQYDLAISEFNKAIEINPMFATAYNNRGVTYGRKGQHDLAISDFSKAIEINPKYASAYTNRGLAYNKKRQHDDAILDFTKALEINPTDARAYISRGVAYYKKGDIPSACSDWKKAHKLNPSVKVYLGANRNWKKMCK